MSLKRNIVRMFSAHAEASRSRAPRKRGLSVESLETRSLMAADLLNFASLAPAQEPISIAGWGVAQYQYGEIGF